MRIFAIGDLHLSFGVANKSMNVFGPRWEGHFERIAHHWKSLIHPDDLVLIPGDISWAMRLEDAATDLRWIDALPGTKVMIKGNHDYWWGSLKKITAILPPSIHLVQNNVFIWKDVAIGGARLWDTPEYSFGKFIEFRENPREKKETEEWIQKEFEEKIFNRELERLRLSLSLMPKEAKIRLAMTHYPPIGANLQSSRASQILEQYNVQACVFGHLHNLYPNKLQFGTRNGVRYILTSCDFLDFKPIQIL